jgi:hypothetical protein
MAIVILRDIPIKSTWLNVHKKYTSFFGTPAPDRAYSSSFLFQKFFINLSIKFAPSSFIQRRQQADEKRPPYGQNSGDIVNYIHPQLLVVLTFCKYIHFGVCIYI